MIEGTVKAIKKLDDGQHKGTIIELSERDKPYRYLDIHIELADKSTIKCGYPNNIMIDSQLGKLLARFGAVLQEGTIIKLDPILVGKSCTFTTVADGKFAKVIGESLKPAIVELNMEDVTG